MCTKETETEYLANCVFRRTATAATSEERTLQIASGEGENASGRTLGKPIGTDFGLSMTTNDPPACTDRVLGSTKEAQDPAQAGGCRQLQG